MRKCHLYLLLIGILYLLTASPCFALPEIPANSFDDDGVGGDAMIADGPDQDNDGYGADQDCDDGNWQVIPGHYYGCNAGSGANSGYRLCGVTGVWGGCVANSTTPLCEATGSGICKYIDCASGSNSNPGTYASPYADGACTGYWQSGAPGCHVSLPPGSKVYLLGSSTCTSMYDPDGAGSGYRGLFWASSLGSPQGNSTNEITIKNYPGATTSIDGPGTNAANEQNAIQVVNSDYLGFELNIHDGFGKPFMILASNHVRVSLSKIYSYGGEEDNNNAGIYYNGGTHAVLDHNLIYNIIDPVDGGSDPSNIAGITLFNDVTGGDHKVNYNRIGYTTPPSAAGNNKGNGIKFKHGSKTGSHGGNEVKGNIIWNATNYGLATFTSKVTATHNLFVDVGTCMQSGVEDTDTFMQTLLFDSNICVDSVPYTIGSGSGGGDTYFTILDGEILGPFVYTKNIFIDSVIGTGGDSGGRGPRIDFYGNDTQFAAMAGKVLPDENCYYHSAQSYKWTYFGAGIGDNTGRPSGITGFTTTVFATWQAGVRDLLSFLTDPLLDSSFRATAPSCANFGWRLISEPNPLPTPSPTPTPTPTPPPGSSAGIRRLDRTFDGAF